MAALLADALLGAGVDVGALRPAGNPLNALTRIPFQRAHHHRSRHAGLAEAIAALRPDLIVPCDDTATAILHEHHARFSGLPEAAARLSLIARSLGDPAQYETARKKSLFIALARAHGVLTPDTLPVRDIAELRAAAAAGPWPKVLKADGGYGGHGVSG